jgi:hypothetical protein
VKIGYRKIQINGEWFYMECERRETEEKFLEEGEKKRRRTGEKRYKEKVKKKVDGQRKRKPEKKYKGEHKKEDTKGEVKVRSTILEHNGIKKKGGAFWEYVRQLKIMGLAETWVEERSWKRNRKVATESTNGKVKSCRENNNRGETGD